MSGTPVFGEPDPRLPLVTRPGSYAVVWDEAGRVAAVRSKRGRLHLPGGGADPGESPVETLRRELLEELGRGCRIIAELGRADCHVAVPHEGASFVKQGTFFDVSLGPPEPGARAECELEWLLPAEFVRAAAEQSHVWALDRSLARGASRSTGRD